MRRAEKHVWPVGPRYVCGCIQKKNITTKIASRCARVAKPGRPGLGENSKSESTLSGEAETGVGVWGRLGVSEVLLPSHIV